MIAAFYLALLAIIYLGMTFYIVSIRRSEKVSLGDGNHSKLTRAIRAHGNFSEFTPMFIIMLYFAQIQNLSLFSLHVLGVLFLIGRISHMIGIISPTSPMICRVGGMVSTLTCYLCLISILLFKNFSLIF